MLAIIDLARLGIWCASCGVAAVLLPASRVGVERCIASTGTERCPPLPSVEECAGVEPARDCLRASVPFRAAYARVECCFRCCVRHWLNVSDLLSNNNFHFHYFEQHGFQVGSELIPLNGKMKNKPPNNEFANPDTADYGLYPPSNLIVHPHAFAVISHTRMHPHDGCERTRTENDAAIGAHKSRKIVKNDR